MKEVTFNQFLDDYKNYYNKEECEMLTFDRLDQIVSDMYNGDFHGVNYNLKVIYYYNENINTTTRTS